MNLNPLYSGVQANGDPQYSMSEALEGKFLVDVLCNACMYVCLIYVICMSTNVLNNLS